MLYRLRVILSFLMLIAVLVQVHPVYLESHAVSMNIDNQILIENYTARVMNQEIFHTATFVNQMNTTILFDAIIRIDNQTETVALDPRTLELAPGTRVSINGKFEINSPGSYTIQWEAITPPPSEAIADRRRVEVIVQQDLMLIYVLAIVAVFGAGVILTAIFLRKRPDRLSGEHSSLRKEFEESEGYSPDTTVYR